MRVVMAVAPDGGDGLLSSFHSSFLFYGSVFFSLVASKVFTGIVLFILVFSFYSTSVFVCSRLYGSLFIGEACVDTPFLKSCKS